MNKQWFSGYPERLKEEFRALAKQWHPDTNKSPDANNNFMEINTTHKELERLIENVGIWEGDGRVFLRNEDTQQIYNYEYYSCHSFEIGKFFVGSTHVVYVLSNESLFNNGLRNIKSFTFNSPRMETELRKYLPEIEQTINLKDGSKAMVIKKTADQLLLADVLNFLKINPTVSFSDGHGFVRSDCVPWILNSLYNLACYLSFAKLTHNDISPLTCFISLQHHSIAILGGWWYAMPMNSPIKIVPKRTFTLIPNRVKVSKLADGWTDLECIRDIGRECLGNNIDTKIVPLLNWLKVPSDKLAILDYEDWQKIVEKCFGKRKFIKTEISEDEIRLTTKKG